MEYILFIHNNADKPTSEADWVAFFGEARASGLFQGGSEIANRIKLGEKAVPDITTTVGGFMRFESQSVDAITELLQKHPVLVNGGTLELCEMPKT